jgi:cytochrome c553
VGCRLPWRTASTAGLNDTAADALRLTCSLLDSPLPPELERALWWRRGAEGHDGMKRTARAVSVAGRAGGGPQCSSAPQDAAALRARSLVATCAACHGTDGRAVPAARRSRAERHARGLPRRADEGVQSGARPAHRDAACSRKGYSDAQIELWRSALAKAGPR